MNVYRQVADCVEKEEDMDIGGSSDEEEVAEMKWQEMKAEADDHYNTHATCAMASVLQRLAAQAAAAVENDEEDELVPTDMEDGYEVSRRRQWVGASPHQHKKCSDVEEEGEEWEGGA